jgi:hypothetical protein
MVLTKSCGPQNKGPLLVKFFSCILFSLLIFCQQTEAESDRPTNDPLTNINNLSVALHYQTPLPLMSDRLYAHWQLATLSVTHEKESGLWPFTKNKELVKSFLWEFRLSRIWGKGIELSQDQVSPEVWDKAQQEGKYPTVDWDHYLIGVLPSYRFYYPLSKAVRLYFEGGLGMTLLNKPLIEGGTIWNFLISGGFGLDCKFKTPFFTFIKFEHISNGGNTWNTFTSNPVRVIGPEGLVFGLGTRFSL